MSAYVRNVYLLSGVEDSSFGFVTRFLARILGHCEQRLEMGRNFESYCLNHTIRCIYLMSPSKLYMNELNTSELQGMRRDINGFDCGLLVKKHLDIPKTQHNFIIT